MKDKIEINELFIKRFSYFFIKYTISPIKDLKEIKKLFLQDDNYKIICSDIILVDEFNRIIKDILYYLALNEIPIKFSRDFILDLEKLLKQFWRENRYEKYIFKFSSYNNCKLVMNVFAKGENPKINSRALFQIENQEAIRKFIMDIVKNITDIYEEYYNIELIEGGLAIDKSYSLCLSSKDMKDILKDYTNAITKLGYKE